MVMPKMVQASERLAEAVIPSNAPRVMLGSRPAISHCTWAPAEELYPSQIVLVQDTFEHTQFLGPKGEELERLFLEMWPLGSVSVFQVQASDGETQGAWTTCFSVNVELIHWLMIQGLNPLPGLAPLDRREAMDVLEERIGLALNPTVAMVMRHAVPPAARNSEFGQVAVARFLWQDGVPVTDLTAGRTLGKFFYIRPRGQKG